MACVAPGSKQHPVRQDTAHDHGPLPDGPHDAADATDESTTSEGGQSVSLMTDASDRDGGVEDWEFVCAFMRASDLPEMYMINPTLSRNGSTQFASLGAIRFGGRYWHPLRASEAMVVEQRILAKSLDAAQLIAIELERSFQSRVVTGLGDYASVGWRWSDMGGERRLVMRERDSILVLTAYEGSSHKSSDEQLKSFALTAARRNASCRRELRSWDGGAR
jgi:hypothetical protein